MGVCKDCLELRLCCLDCSFALGDVAHGGSRRERDPRELKLEMGLGARWEKEARSNFRDLSGCDGCLLLISAGLMRCNAQVADLLATITASIYCFYQRAHSKYWVCVAHRRSGVVDHTSIISDFCYDHSKPAHIASTSLRHWSNSFQSCITIFTPNPLRVSVISFCFSLPL